MKKVIIRIIIIVLLLFVIYKVYHFIISYKMCNEILNYVSEENRYYKVNVSTFGDLETNRSLFLKDNIIKYAFDGENSYCEFMNNETEEKYSFYLNSKELYKSAEAIQECCSLPNLPNFISELIKNNKFNFTSVFDINYIIPVKYEDKICYKIFTKNEVIIIDKNTYLPVHSEMKIINSNMNGKSSIENFYEFEVGNVTDEDIKLPDLNEYTLIEK